MAVETEKELIVSPDGRTLLFSGEGNAEHHGNYIVDLSRQRLLPLAGEADDAPSFSPTAARSPTSRSRGPATGTSACRAFRTGPPRTGTAVRSPGGNDRQPVFLPNGHQLVFASDRALRAARSARLYLLDLRTGTIRQPHAGRLRRHQPHDRPRRPKRDLRPSRPPAAALTVAAGPGRSTAIPRRRDQSSDASADVLGDGTAAAIHRRRLPAVSKRGPKARPAEAHASHRRRRSPRSSPQPRVVPAPRLPVRP